LILTDREIQIALETGAIKIEPQPPAEMLSSTSIDLRLHSEITIFKPPNQGQGINVVLDPTHPEFHPERSLAPYNEKVTIGPNGYALPPRSLVLGWTIEKVDLNSRSRLAARVEGKSSLARIGLGIHITAPTIHAGFGFLQIRLEMINHGYVPINLKAEMRICQLIFEQTLGTPVKGYSGQFLGQGAQ
jgi:dCTP deaminase